MSSLVEKMALETGMPQGLILQIAATAPRRYKVYQVEKRRKGEFRTIAQPSAELKILQRWLNQRVFSELPVSHHATAYRTGISIRCNAEAHKDSRFILKTDFSNFFNSIRFRDLIEHLHGHAKDLTQADIAFIAHVCCWEKPDDELVLSIGAPSSPLLSNSIMYEFDDRLSKFCNSQRLTYTRYADDIAISSAEAVEGLLAAKEKILELLEIIKYPRLTLKNEKTTLLSRKKKRTITGLVIANDGRVGVGREKRRLISAMIDHYERDKLSHDDGKKLAGFLAYINEVDPLFLARLRGRFGIDRIKQIMSLNAKAVQP